LSLDVQWNQVRGNKVGLKHKKGREEPLHLFTSVCRQRVSRGYGAVGAFGPVLACHVVQIPRACGGRSERPDDLGQCAPAADLLLCAHDEPMTVAIEART
jgi:hypothetical protein